MIPRVFAAAGAVILWAYARACRERNATQRRLARANLLRRVSARPEKIKVHVRQLPDSEGGVPQWLAEVADAELTTWQAAIVQQYFDDAMSIEPGDVEISVRRGFESPERKGYPW